MDIQVRPSGLVVPAPKEEPKPVPPLPFSRNRNALRPDEFAAVIDIYQDEMIGCLRSIDKMGGTVLSVSCVDIHGRRWIVVYRAKEEASWEQRT